MRHILFSIVALALVAGCKGERDDSSGDDGVVTTIGSEGTGSDDGLKFDIEGDEGTGPGDEKGDCEDAELPDPNATLVGTVYAPNMEIPISGALVYLTDDPVEPVPDEVYCAECVRIPCDKHHVLTRADGSFELPGVAGDGQQLVVQKGQFLHVVDFNVAEGNNVVQPNQSNLPGQWNPGGGEWIPRIAVYETYPDEVFNVLAKFGMGQVDGSGQLIPGTENFDLISDTDQGAFMDSLANMSQYHIIFVPCASTKYWTGAPTVPPNRATNIQDYVAAGGKYYATDHSNEYIKQPFPMYQDFHSPGMPDLQPAFSSDATIVDEGLLEWLEALPDALKNIGNGNATLLTLPVINTRLNYSGIEAIYDIIVQNEDGEDVNVGHHTWVEGPCMSCSDSFAIRPMAISGQFGCGRMMYSTFENSSTAHAGLNPQELVLLYMILEIGACHGEPPPPPPKVG
jgi:hypothetical protein